MVLSISPRTPPSTLALAARQTIAVSEVLLAWLALTAEDQAEETVASAGRAAVAYLAARRESLGRETPAEMVKVLTFRAVAVAVAEQSEAPRLHQPTAALAGLEKTSAYGLASQPELLIGAEEAAETRNETLLETEALADQAAEALAFSTAALGQ